uniref:Uncharacterized protein n=1 Tax=Triticum urartu TaxID=4572 RepID=A0A8R7UQ59_TRIUA
MARASDQLEELCSSGGGLTLYTTRKHGSTARRSSTTSSPSPGSAESYSPGCSSVEPRRTRPAMTRHTSMPLRPSWLPPPAPASAAPLPANVRTALAAPAWWHVATVAQITSLPPPASAAGRHWNRIISLPSAAHRASPAASPRARAAARAHSKRATARAVLCTRKSASTSAAPSVRAQPDAKMSSTTRRDGWPSGSSVISRSAELGRSSDAASGSLGFSFLASSDVASSFFFVFLAVAVAVGGRSRALDMDLDRRLSLPLSGGSNATEAAPLTVGVGGCFLGGGRSGLYASSATAVEYLQLRERTHAVAAAIAGEVLCKMDGSPARRRAV